MANSVITAGDQATAAKMNQLLGLNSVTFTYNADGTVNTVTDSVTSVVYTFAYNVDGTLNTITDGSNTWTFAYNSEGNCTGYTRT